VTGRVTAVDDAGVTLAVEGRGKPGAKKRPPTPRTVPWGQLGAGRVQVEFGHHEDHHADEHADHHEDHHADEQADEHEQQDDRAGDDDGGGQ
jgi:ribosome maturation factor RimP